MANATNHNKEEADMRGMYIDSGRYPYPTIWISNFKPLGQFPYPEKGDDLLALNIGQALDLWKELTKTLIQAGQTGILDTGLREWSK